MSKGSTYRTKLFEMFNLTDGQKDDFQEWFDKTKILFQAHAFWSVWVAAITPIPDKLFNLLAGLFKINPFVFFIAYLLARSARFFAVGFIMKIFGVRVARIIYRHLSAFLIVATIVILVALFLVMWK